MIDFGTSTPFFFDAMEWTKEGVLLKKNPKEKQTP